MRIFVDADACPVKESILKIAKVHNCEVVFVCSLAHFSDKNEATYIYVDNVSQAADLEIINRIAKGDLVITQDYGLASIVLSKGACALNPRGKFYTEDNIESLLFRRYLSAEIRRQGKRTKGPKAFSSEDKMSFERDLDSFLREKL